MPRPLPILAACAIAASGCTDGGAPRGLPSGRTEQGSSLAQRKAMVREQLEARGIRDARVLHAMGTVPRERFVPERHRDHAYADRPLPIGRGQTISQPYVVAAMAEALHLRGDDRVLEVGSGSGYAAAVLSLLAAEVYGIELEQDLYERSVGTIREVGYGNVHLRAGDGFAGWPEHAPFDAIVLSAAAEEIPGPLWEQLADGGRLIYPRGRADAVQELVLVTKTGEGKHERRLAPVRFVPLRRRRSAGAGERAGGRERSRRAPGRAPSRGESLGAPRLVTRRPARRAYDRHGVGHARVEEGLLRGGPG